MPKVKEETEDGIKWVIMVDLDATEKLLIAHAKGGCKKVLDGEEKSYSNPLLSPSHYEEILTELGAEQLEGEEYGLTSNGWQWYYWQYYEYKGEKFVQSGGGYYAASKFETA